MTDKTQSPSDARNIASLRHLYANLTNGGVRDTASAKRVADGLLAPVIEAMERGAPAAVGEPVAWPSNAAEVREFIGVHMDSLRYHRDDAQPHDDDRYTLSAHDLLSAFRWWTMDAAPPTQPAARMPLIERIAEQWDGCMYDAPGGEIDIGQAIRSAARGITTQGDSNAD